MRRRRRSQTGPRRRSPPHHRWRSRLSEGTGSKAESTRVRQTREAERGRETRATLSITDVSATPIRCRLPLRSGPTLGQNVYLGSPDSRCITVFPFWWCSDKLGAQKKHLSGSSSAGQPSQSCMPYTTGCVSGDIFSCLSSPLSSAENVSALNGSTATRLAPPAGSGNTAYESLCCRLFQHSGLSHSCGTRAGSAGTRPCA